MAQPKVIAKRPTKKKNTEIVVSDEPNVPLIKKFKVLTPETIAIMKTNFEIAFHRHYDKEDSSDNRFVSID